MQISVSYAIFASSTFNRQNMSICFSGTIYSMESRLLVLLFNALLVDLETFYVHIILICISHAIIPSFQLPCVNYFT